MRLGLPNGLFPSGFPTRTLCTPPPYAPHARPSQSSRFYHPHNIRKGVQISKLFLDPYHYFIMTVAEVCEFPSLFSPYLTVQELPLYLNTNTRPHRNFATAPSRQIFFSVVMPQIPVTSSSSSSSSSSSCSYQGFGSRVDPFRSHTSQKFVNGLPRCVLPFSV